MEPNPYESPKDVGHVTPEEIARRDELQDVAALWMMGGILCGISVACQLIFTFFFP